MPPAAAIAGAAVVGAGATLYAGSTWALYNAAKLYKKAPESQWRWIGVNDKKTCEGCRTEIAAGTRPLSKITKRPGEHQCVVNCRCELVQVS